MSSAPHENLAAELSTLAGALRGALRRERSRGRRRAPAPARSPASPGPATSAAQTSRAAQPTIQGSESPESMRARARACADLPSLREAVSSCTACELCASRTQTVFADGADDASVMFIGEAPGADEDASGVPFVGRAGQLLSDIITKGMGMARGQVHIANVLKCRPPHNRDPSASEKSLCTPWLDRQIELVNPRVLIPLGRHAACHILGQENSMGRLRGRIHPLGGRKVVPTYHPAYLLRSPEMKKACWQDIQLAMAELGLEPPAAGNPGQGRG